MAEQLFNMKLKEFPGMQFLCSPYTLMQLPGMLERFKKAKDEIDKAVEVKKPEDIKKIAETLQKDIDEAKPTAKSMQYAAKMKEQMMRKRAAELMGDDTKVFDDNIKKMLGEINEHPQIRDSQILEEMVKEVKGIGSADEAFAGAQKARNWDKQIGADIQAMEGWEKSFTEPALTDPAKFMEEYSKNPAPLNKTIADQEGMWKEIGAKNDEISKDFNITMLDPDMQLARQGKLGKGLEALWGDSVKEADPEINLAYDITQDSQVGYVEVKGEQYKAFEDQNTGKNYYEDKDGKKVEFDKNKEKFTEAKGIKGEAKQKFEVTSGKQIGAVEESWNVNLASGDIDVSAIDKEMMKLHKDGKITAEDMKAYEAVKGNIGDPSSTLGARHAFREHHQTYMQAGPGATNTRQTLAQIANVSKHDSRFVEISKKLAVKGGATQGSPLMGMIAAFGAIKPQDAPGQTI